MKRFKKIWALALRKIGVSIHERIFVINADGIIFHDLLTGKRSAIITPWDSEFITDALVRVREFCPLINKHTNREAHLFINEIIGPNDTDCLKPGFCVLVLK